ncbi:putative ATP-grasp-modified RiPP [Streptomyces sp. NPDC048659]|uniref:putative ATP-grasp-modified RiPP n=1 Tax=Streptomyces sp. NPDC048659 TaxID=3155489 RepID=UPI003423FF83
MTTALDLREVFPLTARLLPSSDPQSSAATRPWILRFARTPDSTQAVTIPPAVYDPESQMSVSLYGGPLPFMQTHTPSVPDGSIHNPPPLDEGPKD